MNQNFCQCCGMPMGDTQELYGSEKDGSKSADYCSYCYDNGAFTADITMEQMIEACIPHMVEANAGMSEDKARESMNAFFPTLKRWR